MILESYGEKGSTDAQLWSDVFQRSDELLKVAGGASTLLIPFLCVF